MKFVLAITFGVVTSAAASPVPEQPPRFGLAANPPTSWLLREQGTSLAIAGSGYIAVNRHHVVRLNAARYRMNILGEAVIAASGNEDECAPGSAFDVGAGWMYFPRERFRGFSLEGGGFVRRRHKADCFDGYDVLTTSTIVAARGLVGWNWLLGGHLYLSVAAGASAGIERGTAVPSTVRMETSAVRRFDVAPEGFIRLGWAFL